MRILKGCIENIMARKVTLNESDFNDDFVETEFGTDRMAIFTATPVSEKVYRFTASYDILSSYAWDFGDGEFDTTSDYTVVHEFESEGNYEVKLAVNGFGLSQNHAETITIIATTNPISYFAVSDDDITLGTMIVFTGINQSGATYSWDFGDGEVDTTSGYTVSHVYDDVDVYTATLTVTIGEASDSYDLDITVRPNASFEVSASEVRIGDTVTLTAIELADALYLWDFGDGEVDTTSGHTVEHIYDDDGTMSISLTVTKNEVSAIGSGSVAVYPEPDYSKVVISDVGSEHANWIAAIIAGIFPTAVTHIVIEGSDMNNAVAYAKLNGYGVVMRATTGLTDGDITGAGQEAEDWDIIPIHAFGDDGTQDEKSQPSYIDTIWAVAKNSGDYGAGLEFQVSASSTSSATGQLAGWVSKLMDTYSPTISELRTLFRNLASNGGVHQDSNGYGIVDFNAVETALQ